jgi:hypothetical protein
MITITEKTRNNKALRLRIYKEALEIIKRKDYITGFCFALRKVLYVPTNGYLSGYKIKKYYPELEKYRPNDYCIYWFKRDEQGQKKRIKILKKIIKEMEDAKATNKSAK